MANIEEKFDLAAIEALEEFDKVVVIGEGENFDPDTGELLNYDDSQELFACANCEGEFTQDELEQFKDFWQRVEPGEIIPAGDCPECGAFCYPKDTIDSTSEKKYEWCGAGK